jgi:hypothetical protein
MKFKNPKLKLDLQHIFSNDVAESKIKSFC